MTHDDVQTRVHEVLGLVLRLPRPLQAPVARADTPDWDSLSHVEIVYGVEESLGVTFTEQELGSLDSSIALVEAVERHLAA